MTQTYNFSPGPAMLPIEVIQQIQAEICDFKSGMSALEINHRHHYFLSLFDELNDNLKKLLQIPNNYRVLWTTGGATAHFSLIPLNLLSEGFHSKADKQVADYFCTGYWSHRAMRAASKYITIKTVVDNAENAYTTIKPQQQWQLSKNPLYVYHTPNETISGLKFDVFPDIDNFSYNNAPIVADMTSCILSEPVAISRYGIIFASAQKNIGPAGITLVIIREDLIQDNQFLPDIFNYYQLNSVNSLLNTSQTFNFYVINLVLKWLLDRGGLTAIHQLNQAKAKKLYDYLDSSGVYNNSIDPKFRSLMNVTFDFNKDILQQYKQDFKDNRDHQGLDHQDVQNTLLHQKFIEQAENQSVFNLAGHRSLGGFRASIYNAMPMAGVERLIEFLKDFAQKI